MRVLSLQAIVEGRLRQMSNGFMLLKSFCNCKGEEQAFKNGVSNYEKEVSLHSWKWCLVGAGCWVFEAVTAAQSGSVCLFTPAWVDWSETWILCSGEPVRRGRAPSTPAILPSEKWGGWAASLSPWSAGIELVPQDGSEECGALRVLFCRGARKCLGTGMGTGITHRNAVVHGSREEWAVLSLSCCKAEEQMI